MTAEARVTPGFDSGAELTWRCLEPGVYYYPVYLRENEAEELRVAFERGPCTAPCGAENGACCQTGGTPGCHDQDCCEAVCAYDPFCCDQAWDALCGQLAVELCPSCGGGACDWSFNTCDTAAFTPGCSDVATCTNVCACDAYCCLHAWDQFCVEGGLRTGCLGGAGCENGSGDQCVASPFFDCNADLRPDLCNLGDFNGDGAVDRGDAAAMVTCQTSPGTPLPDIDPVGQWIPCCRAADFDRDGDRDLRDWATFLARIQERP